MAKYIVIGTCVILVGYFVLSLAKERKEDRRAKNEIRMASEEAKAKIRLKEGVILRSRKKLSEFETVTVFSIPDPDMADLDFLDTICVAYVNRIAGAGAIACDFE